MSLAPTTVRSTIEQVTVHRIGAEIRRVVEIDLPDAFPATVQVCDLPLQLRDDTLQLSVEALEGGASEACPTAVDVQVALEPPPPDTSLPPATDDDLLDAKRSVRRRRRDLRRLEAELLALGGLDSPSRPEGAEGEPPPSVPVAARLELLAFRRTEQEKLLDKLGPARERHRQAREALAQLQARRESEQQHRQLKPHELRKQARVTLQAPRQAPQPPRIRLVLSYLVPAARWAPSYTLHLEPASGRVRLAMRAQVCQLTGEDWSGVRLVLSTADALRWADLPELHALRIGRAQPAPPSTGWRPAPDGADALYDDYRRAAQRIGTGAYGGMASGGPPLGDGVVMMGGPPQPKEMAALREDTPMAACEEPECEEEVRRPPMRRAKKSKRRPAPRAAKSMSFALSASMAPPAPQSAPQAGAFQGHGGGGHPPEPPPPPGVDAGRDLLDYDALRMAGPDAGQPGKLQRVDSLARYRELLPEAQRRSLPGMHELRASVQQAAGRVGSQPLPAGLRAPQSIEAFDHAWRGEAAVDVPDDGHFHTVPVLQAQAEGEIHYVAVPRETQDVFRALHMRNPLSAPLLAGPVDVYLDGDYLLAASLDTVPGGGEVELGLGVEEGVRVARNTRFEEHQRGMVSRHQDLQHTLEVELRNLLAQAVQIEVRERIPVVREDDDDITVELRTVEPPWEAWEQPRDPVRGTYRWQLELPAGGVRQLRADYVVTISPKHELVGGNRREA